MPRLVLPRVLVACSLLVLGSWQGSARAEGAPPALEWHAPAGCPGPAPVLEKLSELLGPDPSWPARYDAIVGQIRADSEQGWVLSLELHDRSGKRVRRLSARHCDDLATAAAVALALVLDADEERAAGAPAVGNGWQATAVAAPAEASVAAAPVTAAGAATVADSGARDRGPPPLTPALGVELVLDSAALGPATLGAGVQAALRIDRLSLGLGAVYLPPHERSVRADAQQVEFTLIAGGPRACYRLLAARGQVDACAGVELGRFAATGVALRDARAVRDLWLAPGVGLGFDWPLLADLALAAHVDLLTPLEREEYVINGAEAVHRVPPALLRLGLGLKISPE
jgi:hypothetical protein